MSKAEVVLRSAAVALVCLGVLPLANLMTAGTAIPWWPAAVRDWAIVGSAVVLAAMLAAGLLGHRADDVIRGAARLLTAPSPRTFTIAVGAIVLLLATVLSWYCFHRRPFTGDEMAQLWHARILLSGRLFLTPEAHPEFFATPEVLDGGGRWFSQFPIGGPLVLAPGLFLGAPWLINPILAAFTVVHVYRFAARTMDETTARAAALLFALSPFVLIMSASEMNHVATLAFVSVALAALPRWTESADPRVVRRTAALIGLGVGAAATIRPMDAALVAAAFGVFQLAIAWREPVRRPSLAWELGAGAIPVALLLWANVRTTGSALRFGYDALNGAAHLPGFHLDPAGIPFTPYRALATTSGYLMSLNRYLFEWPVPALAVIAAGLATIRRPTRWEIFLVGLLAAVVAGYTLYWFNGFFAGPRFLYTALPALVIFAARAPASLAAWLRDRARWPTAARAMLLLVPLCAVYAWAIPTGMSSVRARAMYYRRQQPSGASVEREVRNAKLTNALVFVPGTWRSRLLARLQGYGMPPLAAVSLLDSTDACALQGALDAADSIPNADRSQRLPRVLVAAGAAGRAAPVPGLPSDRQIALVPGSRPTETCLREFSHDVRSPEFARFLDAERIDADGRIGGPVVFARDLGPRDTLLMSRFGDRTWYQYEVSTGEFVKR